MTSNIKIGQQVRVTIRFVDFDPINETDDLLIPSSVSGALYKYNDTTAQFDLQDSLSPIVNDSTGIYHYDWTTTENGKFRLLFIGTFDDATPSTVENPRDFYVGTAEPTVTLSNTYEQTFLSALDPLYLDPERISLYYPEVDLVEATEIIYRLSVEMQDWFGTSFDLTEPMEEYLLAATLCELTKIHTFNGGMEGFANISDFTLGDLQVNETKGGSFSNKALNRGNVATWCELANLLRVQLTFSRSGIKAFVRGSNYENPIPVRALRRFERPRTQ